MAETPSHDYLVSQVGNGKATVLVDEIHHEEIELAGVVYVCVWNSPNQETGYRWLVWPKYCKVTLELVVEFGDVPLVRSLLIEAVNTTHECSFVYADELSDAATAPPANADEVRA
jgi:hypothetical protein